jgi:matrilin
MSIHFFDSTFDPYIYYGNNRANMLNMIQSKAYRGAGTATGSAINASVALIKAKQFPNGVPKILVILTDGGSYDSVIEAANNARANGIVLFCVGIGANVNTAQLLQITGSASNIVYISSYSSLNNLVSLI